MKWRSNDFQARFDKPSSFLSNETVLAWVETMSVKNGGARSWWCRWGCCVRARWRRRHCLLRGWQYLGISSLFRTRFVVLQTWCRPSYEVLQFVRCQDSEISEIMIRLKKKKKRQKINNNLTVTNHNSRNVKILIDVIIITFNDITYVFYVLC